MDTTPAPEFKSWREIERFNGLRVVITEKIHGSNAQVHVYRDANGDLKALAGKRTAYVGMDGHFGFGLYVHCNEADICAKLGEGRHYGEWVGPGVNQSYGLTEKRLVLFDYRRHPQAKKDAGQLPDRMDCVPVLFDGVYTPDAVRAVQDDLRANGSRYAPGFMHPEGVVLNFPDFGAAKKLVFKAEETGWTKAARPAGSSVKVNYSAVAAPLLQPVRLEKLLMRDERYMAEFPRTIPDIARDYIADLLKETPGLTEEQIRAVKKCAYPFAKEQVEAMLLKGGMVTA